MVVDLVPAHSPKKPHYIRIITKRDDPNILNIFAQEIPWPKDPVLRPSVVPVTSESMDEHKTTITNCYLGCSHNRMIKRTLPSEDFPLHELSHTQRVPPGVSALPPGWTAQDLLLRIPLV